MSEALLCDVCPSFGPCHIGEDVHDEHCWNWRRDNGLELVSPVPEPARDDERAPENPVLARALKRLEEDAGKNRRPATTPREPRPKPVREPKPPKVKTPREPKPKAVKPPRQPRPKKVSAPRRTPEELLEIRRGNMIRDYEKRCGALWRSLFGTETPPIRSRALIGRPDLWKYAEARIAAKAPGSSIRSDLCVLGRITPERLQDPTLIAVDLAGEQYENSASIKVAASAVRRYRRIHGIDLIPDEVAVTVSRRDAAKAWCQERLVKAFDGREPPVKVLALAHRPDLWAFAEQALAAGFAHETVTTNARKLAHIPAEDLVDLSKSAHDLAPGEGRTAAFLRGAVVRFRTVTKIQERPE